jgi:hypothetical protein
MLIAASPHVVPVSAGFVAAVLVPLLAEQVPLQPALYSEFNLSKVHILHHLEKYIKCFRKDIHHFDQGN